MKTNADLAAQLLRESAKYFRSIGDQNPPIKDEIYEKADNVEIVAKQVTEIPDVAARYLRESAGFFRHIGTTNESLRETMESNARTFEAVAILLEKDPAGFGPELRLAESETSAAEGEEDTSDEGGGGDTKET